MKWYEIYLFIILAGSVGYALASVTGFLLGALWAIIVSVILSLFAI